VTNFNIKVKNRIKYVNKGWREVEGNLEWMGNNKKPVNKTDNGKVLSG
jgi:hypothetical protein